MSTTFRKKPVEIEAQQYTDAKSSSEIIQRILDADGSASLQCVDPDEQDHGGHTIRIRTLEGDMHASLGDWVIQGVKGEFYPCKPDIFESTYAEVDPKAQATATARFFTASEHPDVVALREHIVALGAELIRRVPTARHRDLALELLEDLQMRANRGIFAERGFESRVDRVAEAHRAADEARTAAASAQAAANQAYSEARR